MGGEPVGLEEVVVAREVVVLGGKFFLQWGGGTDAGVGLWKRGKIYISFVV